MLLGNKFLLNLMNESFHYNSCAKTQMLLHLKIDLVFFQMENIQVSDINFQFQNLMKNIICLLKAKLILVSEKNFLYICSLQRPDDIQ